MNWKVEMDGSLSIGKEQTVFLEGMFPGIDGRNIRPRYTEVIGNEICWTLAEGEVHLRIEESESGNGGRSGISLHYSLENFKKLPHTFYFFHRAKTNADGFYQAAEGMGGETGFLSRKTLQKEGYMISYGLGGLCFQGESPSALLVYSKDQKNYENILEAEYIKKPFYTDGWGQNTQPEFVECSYGVRTEEAERTSVVFPPLELECFDSLEEGLEKAAEAIGAEMQARLSAPAAYHWCSWYYCYQNFDRVQLEEYLTGLETEEKKLEIRYVQLDVGYCPSIGDWLEENERFPLGLKEAFQRIEQAGYLPGIWVGPFMVGNRSHLYAKHPDWILYDLEGKPVRPWITDNEPKPWGYQDEEYYVLDTSHPDAMEYMRTVFSTLHSWGARMFKTDFMLWGLQDSSRVKRHTPGKTSVEYFREYLQMIRDAIGEDSYWLGCIAPFIPFVGYADGMRIGGDVGSAWDGEFGPQNMMRCLVGNNYTNHHYYQTDPDAVMLRDFQIRLNECEIYSLALLAAMSGSCIYTSDPLHRIAKERRELFDFIKPDIRRKPYLPYLAEERKEIVMVQKGEKKSLLFILNKSETPLTQLYPMSELGIPEEWKIVRLKDGKTETLWNGSLPVEAEPHGCRLYLAAENPDIEISYENLWKNL